MSERETTVLRAVKGGLNNIANVCGVYRRMGLRRRDAFGVNATLRSLERRGLVLRIPPKDRWAVTFWALTDAGEAALTTRPDANTQERKE